MAVGIDPIALEAEQDGLAAAVLRAAISLKLQRGGIRLIQPIQAPPQIDTLYGQTANIPGRTEVGSPYLTAHISTLKIPEINRYVFGVSLNLKRWVWPVGDTIRAEFATTWHVEQVGLVHTENMALKIGEVTGDLVDVFTAEFQQANFLSAPMPDPLMLAVDSVQTHPDSASTPDSLAGVDSVQTPNLTGTATDADSVQTRPDSASTPDSLAGVDSAQTPNLTGTATDADSARTTPDSLAAPPPPAPSQQGTGN